MICIFFNLLNIFYFTNVIVQLNGTYYWELVSDDYALVVLHTTLMIPFYLWCVLGGTG